MRRPPSRAVLVVGGESRLGQAVAARLAAVAPVVLGEVDPARLGPALAEVDRVRALYGRAEVPALAVGPDVAALVRCAGRVLPSLLGVVFVEPPPLLDVAGVVGATDPGTSIVLVVRTPPLAPAPPDRVRRQPLDDERTLWSVTVGASGASVWTSGTVGAVTEAEAEAARTVRDLLIPTETRAGRA